MKFLRYVLLLVGLGLSGALRPATAQVFDWAQLAHNKGSNFGYSQASCTDRLGNTFVSIGFSDSARIGGQLVRGAGNSTGGRAVVKYDSLGRVAWVKVLSGVAISYRSMTPDPAGGGIFVSGFAYANATWGGVPLPGGVSRNFFGKCSATGTLLWANALPGDQNTFPVMDADGPGNLYLMGSTSINYPLTNSVGVINGVRVDTTQTFIVKTNPGGVIQWVRLLRGVPTPYLPGPYNPRDPSGIAGFGLCGRPGGGCLIYGTYHDSLYFDNGRPTLASRSTPGEDTFITQLTPAGTLAWARPGADGSTSANPTPGPDAVAVDPAGNYYVTGSSSRGLGVAKYTDAGVLVWTTSQDPTATPTGSDGTQIGVDDAGEVSILAVTNNFPTDPPTVIGGYVLRNPYSVIHFDRTGQPRWALANGLTTQPSPPDFFYYDPVSMGVDGAGNVYLASETGSSAVGASSSHVPPVVRLGDFTLVGGGVSVARIGTRHNIVRGRLYLDANGNGVRDGSEGAFPENMALEATQATRASLGTFDTQGFFNVYVGAGAYSLAAPVPPLHYALTQPTTGPYTGSFVGYGRVDTARHFGFQPIANQADVRVSLTPYGAARPGFTTRYRVTVQNVGTTTVASGTATATLDSRMAYISSMPTGSRAGQTVTWTYANLAPFERREFDVLFSLPTNTPLGTQLSSTAGAPLAADIVPADNTASATQTVTGSFDPNDITVNYQRLTPAQVAAQLPLDYTVRFQNMGTDTAFTVVVTDTLDFQKLNVASIQLVAQSHNCIWSLSGTGRLTVRFLNINLPYRNQDVIRSQGFVRFRVQPRPTLAVGEVIPNHAGIVFDYNAAIRTNTATTTVFVATAALASHTAPAWEAYPNPVTDVLNVAADLPTAGPVRVELFDGLGRSLRQHTINAPAGPLRQQFDLHDLAPGLYVLRLTPPTGPALSRQVVRE